MTTQAPLPPTLPAGTRPALFLISAATLLFEINLTRIFSVAQFYHFAFMIVSIALLGFGASGTLLALLPGAGRTGTPHSPGVRLGWTALAAGSSLLIAYLLTNWLPFDSFSIAWDRRQVWILVAHYLALSAPFFCSGLAVGSLLSSHGAAAGRVYAVNLLGSAAGCLAALLVPAALGGEGAVTMSAALAALGALSCLPSLRGANRRRPQAFYFLLLAGLLVFSVADLGGRLLGRGGLPWMALQISPYKSLSYALQYPGAQVIDRRWNSFSRVDLVRSPGVRSLPGLSYRYLQQPPPEDGLLMDGDDLSPVMRQGGGLDFVPYLPAHLAYQLRPQAEVLVLEPRGGLDVLAALASGARRVTAVEANPLVVQVARDVYATPGVNTVVEDGRSFLRRTAQRYDVCVLTLTASYHPVRSGAYSLAEDYRYTQQAFGDMLARLQTDGLLVVPRWLQPTPSESLRAFALAVSALQQAGEDPARNLVAIRGYNLATLFVKRTPFTTDELAVVRAFAADYAFDLIYAPDMLPAEANRYNRLPEPVYYQEFNALLQAADREAYYAAYPFDVRPPTDDHPFFGHFFKWSQARQVIAELGKTWQPFGGAGYFVVLALLGLALLAGLGIILLPVLVRRLTPRRPSDPPDARLDWAVLGYFAFIGLAYLLVEIPLFQGFILFLGQPAYALTAVLFSLLLFSGLGSWLSERLPLQVALPGLVALLIIAAWLLPIAFAHLLGLSFPLRLVVAMALIAPVGVLMGVPFPAGVTRLAPRPDRARVIGWAWGVNGAASVVSAVLAALLALSWGFRLTFWTGALCYALAWLMAWVFRRRYLPPPAR